MRLVQTDYLRDKWAKSQVRLAEILKPPNACRRKFAQPLSSRTLWLQWQEIGKTGRFQSLVIRKSGRYVLLCKWLVKVAVVSIAKLEKGWGEHAPGGVLKERTEHAPGGVLKERTEHLL